MIRLASSERKGPCLSWSRSLSPGKLCKNRFLLNNQDKMLTHHGKSPPDLSGNQKTKTIRYRAQPGSAILATLLAVLHNETSIWRQVGEILEFMEYALSLRIVLDPRRQYKDVPNSRLVLNYPDQSAIVGCCLDDKVLGSSFSLLPGRFHQPLTNAYEFFLRIRFCRETEVNEDFIVITRVEALMTGWSVTEALTRTIIYLRAGADIVIVRSRNDSDITDFLQALSNEFPVLIVPTKYFVSCTMRTEELGISVSVWKESLYKKLTDSSSAA